MAFGINHSLVLPASARAVQFDSDAGVPWRWHLHNFVSFPFMHFSDIHFSRLLSAIYIASRGKKAVVKPIFCSVENMENRQVTILPLVSNSPTMFVCGCMQFSTGDFLSKNYSNSIVPQFPYVWIMDNSHFNKILTVMFVKLWSVL